MTQEEKDALIAEAKRHYPVGTEYNCACDGHINTAERDPEIIDTVDGDIDVGIGYIRYNGKWAKIVSTPQPQFEVGKWYKNLGSVKSYIAKAGIDSKIEDKIFWHTDYISDLKKFTSRGKAAPGLDWNSDTVECPLSEIQQYLPEGHPDKFVAAKDEEWIPKEGEYVVVESDNTISAGGGNNTKYKDGDILKVKSVDISEVYWQRSKKRPSKNYWVFVDGHNNAIVISNLRPALPHEIPGNKQQKTQFIVSDGQVPVYNVQGDAKMGFFGTSGSVALGDIDGPLLFPSWLTKTSKSPESEPEIKPIPNLKEDLYIPSKTILF